MTSELVKSGNMDGMIKFIPYGSPADWKSLVKMPVREGHLDLWEEEIRDIAKQVINLAKNYLKKKPSAGRGFPDTGWTSEQCHGGVNKPKRRSVIYIRIQGLAD